MIKAALPLWDALKAIGWPKFRYWQPETERIAAIEINLHRDILKASNLFLDDGSSKFAQAVGIKDPLERLEAPFVRIISQQPTPIDYVQLYLI
ncbi:hypothetical protein [Mesorhizobium sp.]|uniref:hypothetical protein n=1 Tax=Mesorhizobium sp. TaxID=1871066 RepID=UPI0025EE6E12|nr:hypothetical protein [Mesorhizobium sp.]